MVTPSVLKLLSSVDCGFLLGVDCGGSLLASIFGIAVLVECAETMSLDDDYTTLCPRSAPDTQRYPTDHIAKFCEVTAPRTARVRPLMPLEVANLLNAHHAPE